MEHIIIRDGKLLQFIDTAEGYVSSKLDYVIIHWLNIHMTAFWKILDETFIDSVILYFDSKEDAILFKLTWM